MQIKPSIALVENLITLLAYDDQHGRIVANLIDPTLFEGDYREVAERIVEYWRGYGQAPKVHTADLFADIIEDPNNRRARNIRQILTGMVQLADSVNTGYVIDQLRKFTRLQRLKGAILQSAERLNNQQHMAIEEVEGLWSDLLRAGESEFEPGLRLSDVDRITSSLQQAEKNEFVMGVPDLDSRGVVPARGEAMLMIAPKGRGKSWSAVHVGKSNLLQRKKILHVSLEMSEEQVGQRYYQSLFSVTKREQEVRSVSFERDADGAITDLVREDFTPEFHLTSSFVYDEIYNHAQWLGNRFDNLIVKRFPTRGLTVRKLEGYLDTLEITQRFIPDMLILDYIGIMHTDPREHRISLGRTFEDLRGLLVERNMAGYVPHQGGRAAADARDVKPTHVAEDWSLVHTADQVLTLSSTKAERRLGLARLFVGHSRQESDGFGAVIIQNYDVGQFCLDSAPLKANYYDMLDEYVKEEGLEDDEDDDD